MGGYNGGNLFGGFCPRGILSRVILSGGVLSGGFCPRTEGNRVKSLKVTGNSFAIS